MAELLLELFSEEIPARMQKNAAEELKSKLIFYLKEQGLYHQKVKSFVTPRRLVVAADGLSLTQEEKTEERRGPRVGAPDKAIEGFVKSAGLRSADDLIVKDTGKGEFYFAIQKTQGKPTKDILKEGLEEIIASISWPKSQRWGSYETRWVRPLKNIACVFGGDILPLKYGHLVANDNSEGHRFLSEGAFKVNKFNDYKQELNSRFVMLDHAERQQVILDAARELAAEHKLELVADEKLLEEVAGLVEWPVVLMGKIEPEYMDIPDEALISSIRTHQKYFTLKGKDGKLAPYFIVVSNMETPDGGAHIIAGNERVLRARLADANFFYDQDRKVPLEQRVEKLKSIVFHARLGSLYDKTQRVAALAKFLAVWVPHANLDDVERAALLSKADLATEMVGEFPELQGTMGYYYALEEGEPDNVALAIYEHYKPAGSQDAIPTNPESITLAICDKMDTLAGLFAIDEHPTGSKDPFALRRAALGIIRIILENRLSIPLNILIDNALKHYPKQLFTAADEDEEAEKRGLLKRGKKRTKVNPAEIAEELRVFFIERLKALLKSEEIRHDLINAVMGAGEDDVLRMTRRVAALDKFLHTEDGEQLLQSYKRAVNILAIEEKKDNAYYRPLANSAALEQHEEKRLFTASKKARTMIKDALKQDDFEEAMNLLSKLRKPIDAFFDKVVVNANNKELRTQRLKLLSSLRELYDDIADFSEIEG